MKGIKYIGILLVLLISINAFSQNRNWTIENSEDGKSSVNYELIKEDEGTHFYYIAQTIAKVSLTKLDAYFSNTTNHKNFLERTPTTEEIKRISDNEWLAYYFFDAPWPLSNSDIVIRINRTKTKNKLIFIAQAISSNYKKSDNETTKITYNADYIPVGSIPKFLIKTWFPEGPINIVKNIGARK